MIQLFSDTKSSRSHDLEEDVHHRTIHSCFECASFGGTPFKLADDISEASHETAGSRTEIHEAETYLST